MPSTGIPLQQVSELVQSTDFQGFPVVKSPTDRTIIGFVRKNELRYALDRARRTRQLSNDAVCTFQAISEDSAQSHGLSGAEPDIVLPAGEGRARESRTVDFGQYIDEVSFDVHVCKTHTADTTHCVAQDAARDCTTALPANGPAYHPCCT